MVTEREHDAKTKAITKSVKRVFIKDIFRWIKETNAVVKIMLPYIIFMRETKQFF